jgi:hypothetical protein
VNANNQLQNQLQENPPESPHLRLADPIDPVPIEVRLHRVHVQGSRRKRDLAAVERHEAQQARNRAAAALAQSDSATALAPEVWADALKVLAACIPDATFRIWVEPLNLIGTDGSTVFLSAPLGIAAWCERRYSTLIREALEAQLGREIAVEFIPTGDAGEMAA